MPCKKPFVRGSIEFGCYQCLGCRIQRKKDWVNRLVLENKKHSESSFLTLTYDDEHMPKYFDKNDEYRGGTLDPEDYRSFLHRFRKAIWRKKRKRIRFFLVGEYGDKTERPHYHAAIFGVSCTGPDPRYYNGKKCECDICRIAEDSWRLGFIGNGTLEQDSINYIAGYVHKTVDLDGEPIMGLTNEKDQKVSKWLSGRHPEFTRMSRSPGIGGDCVDDFLEMLFTDAAADFIAKNGDIPGIMITNGKLMVLPRYLKRKIKEKYGWKEKKTVRGTKSFENEESMLKLSQKNIEERERIWSKAKKIDKDPFLYETQVKKEKIKRQEKRAKIFAKAKGGV